MKPLVSVVVLTYNGKHFLEKLLPTLKSQTYEPLEVVVVDNNSTDGSAYFVKKNFPKFVLVENKTNRGYCGGNNDGMRTAKGEYVAVINDDTECDPKWVSEAVKCMELSPRVGVVATKVLHLADKKTIDTVGININRDCSVLIRGSAKKDSGVYDSITQVFSGAGNGVFYRKEMLDEIGFFDEDFWIHYDETDLCFRARLRGWSVYYTPTSLVYHVKAGTEGVSLRYLYNGERNRIWVMIKNAPWRIILKSPYHTFKRIFSSADKHSGQRYETFSKPVIFWTILKAWMAAMYGMPKMLKKRNKIQKKRLIRKEEVLEFFNKFNDDSRVIP